MKRGGGGDFVLLKQSVVALMLFYKFLADIISLFVDLGIQVSKSPKTLKTKT